MIDPAFSPDAQALAHALHLLRSPPEGGRGEWLAASLPEVGLGGRATLDALAPAVLGGASRLGGPTAMAHMDPPTPWITWATTMWNASLNQNLLHPATAPVARKVEEKVVEWLSPYFGMDGGHMVPGSTAANLTALWAARECRNVDRIVCAETAHLSVEKSARILGLKLTLLPCGPTGALLPESLPHDLSRSALVLTAGGTSAGAVDDLSLVGKAAWTHVDAAWAGPLRFSRLFANRLAGIEGADSVAVSAHKLMFQPKESALVLFRNSKVAEEAISFGGAYLSEPNVGLLGSHGAAAVPLLATLLAWGREGLAERIDRCMLSAADFAEFIDTRNLLELLAMPETGIVVWRPRDHTKIQMMHSALPAGSTSLTTLPSGRWLRNVAANPNLELGRFKKEVSAALQTL